MYLHGILFELSFGVQVLDPLFGQLVPDPTDDEGGHHRLLTLQPQRLHNFGVVSEGSPINQCEQGLCQQKNLMNDLISSQIYHVMYTCEQ